MKSVMLTATEARAKSQNDAVIFNEIRDIENAILTSVDTGDYTATIDNTTMTSSILAQQYYDTWQGTRDDRARFIQMGQVITYFTDLGYNIERRTNASTGNTFKWIVSW